MLVLRRNKGETIQIGNDIVITACSGRCTIGVEAPEDVKINRGPINPKVIEPQNESTNAEKEIE